MDDEVPLPGGSMTPVVRVGATVRRPTGPWTEPVHALLRYLEGAGFAEAPRPVGTDEHGREVLTYLDGAAGVPPFPRGLFADDTLVRVARLLRRYHDVSAGFVPDPGAPWRRLPGAPTSGPVICHNDLAWWNLVFASPGTGVAGEAPGGRRGCRPVGLIDWDFAAPGPPEWDVAMAVWRLVPLYGDDDCRALGWPVPDNRGLRLRMFCDAYGLDDRSTLLDLVGERQQVARRAMLHGAAHGDPAMVRMVDDGHADGPLRDLGFLARHRVDWQRALGG